MHSHRVRTFTLSLIGVFIVACSGSSDSAMSLERSSIRVEQLEIDDQTRYYSVYRPRRYQPGAPVVVLLHGGAQSMRTVLGENTATHRWTELAERDGFLLIVPNGYSIRSNSGAGNRQVWNDLRGEIAGRQSGQDDVGFILAALNRVQRQYRYDPFRVYVTGSSNGGMMAMRLLIEAPKSFAAGAAFIASLPKRTIPDPPSATPIMMMNGTKDRLVRWQGGLVARRGGLSRAVEASVDYFRRANGVSAVEPRRATLPDRVPGDGCRISAMAWPSEARNAPQVLFYKVEGGGHNIPDPTPPSYGRIVQNVIGPQCRDVHGVDLAWRFFQSHSSTLAQPKKEEIP